jgi:small ligand-binding sensory domain FIST
MIPSTSTGLLRFAAGVSTNPDAAKAAEQVCAQCADGLGAGSTDLAVAFVSYHHVGSMDVVAAAIRRELRVDCLIGVSAEGVVAGRAEHERTPAISLLSARMPGVSIVPFTGQELMPYDESPEGLAKVGRAMGADEDLRGILVFADPFSVPMAGLLPVMNRARAHGRVGPIIGGMASGATAAGGNALILDDKVYRTGLVGVGLRGAVRIDPVVSQGCRAFGPPMVITKAKKNIIFELGRQPAINMVREAVESIPDEDKKLLEKGLFIGRVINEYKDRFGRDDFLIRNVIGVDENHGAIAVAELMRVGQTVRLHLRDAKTADEDLSMLLDAQQLREPPLGAMMVTCNGRGSRLFDRPNHDALAVARAFAPGRSGEELSKGGEPIDAEGPTLPLAGYFAAGEIGPVGDESYLHGQTAVMALFRNPR